MHVFRKLGLTLLAAGVAVPAAAQQKVALGKPTAETAESFTRIFAVRELPSGKVILVDPQDKVVQLVDLAAGTVTKIGREGNGPGEYSTPMGLVGLPDGTTLVHDIANRRFLKIGLDGKPGEFISMPRPSGGAEGGGPQVVLGGITQVRGYDARGRMYFQGSPFSASGGTADSIAILRWDIRETGFDTVGFFKPPANSASRTQSGGAVTVRIGTSVQFTPSETWAVADDGSIARVFPNPYRVAWLNGRGPAAMGPVVPYTPMKVTEADKKQVIDGQSRTRPTLVSIGGGGGGGGGGARSPQLQIPTPEFAETKPPFVATGFGATNSVMGTPDGEIWVLRTRPAGDKIPSYDVFDGTGKLVKQVTLSPNTRIIGFGKGTVYAIRTDEDDLQYLQRYQKP